MGKKKTVRFAKLQDAVKPKAEQVKQSLCSVSFITLAIKTVILVIFYYVFSIGLTFYNKTFVHHFNFPLSMTMTHLVVKFMLAGMVRSGLECYTKKPRVTLPWSQYLKRIALPGMASVLDIGLSNWSFKYITVSLYTMSKSSAVIFILMGALLLRLEKWRWSLLLVVLFIASGLFMFTYHSTQFSLKGFIMVMTASVLSGFRWTLSQIVLQKNDIGLQNPLDMMYHIQPWMIVTLFPMSIAFEGVTISTTDQLFRFSSYSLLMENISLVMFGACLAFMLEFSEYLLLSQTSSLTLSISGIFKELCTLILAAVFNGDRMNTVNGLGLVVCLSGIILHVILKAIHNREDTNKLMDKIEDMELLSSGGSHCLDDDEEEEEIYTQFNSR